MEPERRIFFLRQFLNLFREITNEDRQVLLHTLTELPEKELKDELINLCDIFE